MAQELPHSAFRSRMDDVWARLALVGGALAVAALFAWWQRSRVGRTPIRTVDPGELAPGVYFFVSSACPTCSSAREKLTSRLGEDGYTEFGWEQSPGVFADMEIEAVPSVMIVAGDGSGTVYPGQPDQALRRV
jgi:hypothetical protein